MWLYRGSGTGSLILFNGPMKEMVVKIFGSSIRQLYVDETTSFREEIDLA